MSAPLARSLPVQIQREFWEHRSLWIVPVALASLLLLGCLLFSGVHAYHVDVDVDGEPLDLASLPLFEYLIIFWALPFYLTTLIIVGLYLLDCLYAERRDRSILFWRSMPVSDTRTVLVKLLVGLVVVPLGTFAIAALTSLIGGGILQLRQPFAPHAIAHWNMLSWLRIQGTMLYCVFAWILWLAPYAAYLMLASVWAQRSPAAWAAIPPILLLMLEPLIFGTHYSAQILERGSHELMQMIFHPPGGRAISPNDFVRASAAEGMPPGFIDPTPLLLSAKLWLGLIGSALLLALTIRLRRWREQ